MKKNVLYFILIFVLVLAGLYATHHFFIKAKELGNAASSIVAETTASKQKKQEEANAKQAALQAAQIEAEAKAAAAAAAAAQANSQAQATLSAQQAAQAQSEADKKAEEIAAALEAEKKENAKPKLPAMTGKNGADEVMSLLSQALSKKDAAMLEILQKKGVLSEEQAAAFKLWMKDNNVKKVEAVGTVIKDGATYTRYRIQGDKTDDILIDLAEPKKEGDTWTVVQTQNVSSEKSHVSDNADSLQLAESFFDALRHGDMLKARSMTLGRGVSAASLAGLCMVFDEGSYALRNSKPIRSIFENDDKAGYLAYFVGANATRPANVGIEMQRNDTKAWRVSALSLDALLSSYEASGNAEGGRYFPIVKNPKGGDSLALFFAFDDSSLTPRSMKQLAIVAQLLQVTQRRLDISGHTDDVGSNKYNDKLSLRRAKAVREALIGFNVTPSQINIEGMGKRQPRRSYSPNSKVMDEETLRAENRRAEIYLDFQ